jgi:hypothetical protein
MIRIPFHSTRPRTHLEPFYHNNIHCAAAMAIPPRDLSAGTNGSRLCPECSRLDRGGDIAVPFPLRTCRTRVPKEERSPS